MLPEGGVLPRLLSFVGRAMAIGQLMNLHISIPASEAPLGDYALPSGEFGIPLHHPRFLEWIGVPESAGLLEMGRRGGCILGLGTRLWMRLSNCIGMFV